MKAEETIEEQKTKESVQIPETTHNASQKFPANLRRFFTAFWPFVRPYRWYLAVAYLATGIVSIASLAPGYIIYARLDEVLDNLSMLRTIADFALLLILVLVVREVINVTAQYTIAWAGANYIRNIRNSVFARVMDRGDEVIDKESSGELQTRVIADTAQLGNFIGGSIPGLLSTVIGLIGGVGSAIFVSPRLTLIAVGVAVVMTIPILAFSPILRRFGERLQKAEAQSGRHAGETFRSRDIVYAFNQIVRENKVFSRYTGAVKRFFLAQELLQLCIFGTFRLFAFTLLIFGASYVLNLIVANQLSAGTATAFAYFAVMIIGSAQGVASLITSFNVALGRAQKLIEILALPERPVQEIGVSLPGECEIELRNICFTYPTRTEQTLTDISLTLPARSKVAIVGVSGSGKSTIFKILLKIIEPSSGTMLAGGVPSIEFSSEAWRSHFGFVPQAEMLTSGTVAENISYGKSKASREEVIYASELAFAHEFIETLPNGYETDLGEVGARLSGGQKQRISLARAILINPSVYLLDEATSSLDAASEQAVEQALTKLRERASVVVIAHRISTVENADLIVVLDEGRVVNQGNHQTLLQDSNYERLVSQYRR